MPPFESVPNASCLRMLPHPGKTWRLLLLLVGLLAAPARAQEAALEGTLPDSIVVTASREAEGVRRTGRRITVLTARDIARLPAASFDELLRSVGGVEVQSRGGFGVQSDLTMRGSTFNGVLVLLDGARLNDPMTGHFLADFPVPLAEIARIEVLRGPATSLYGPDALGGVIQVFTYTGLREAGTEAGPLEGRLQVERGRYDLFGAGAAARRNARHATLSAATVWQRSDGMPITDAAGRPIRGSVGAVRSDFARQAHSAAVARDLGPAVLYARAGYDARDFGAFHFYTPFPSDTAREATSTLWGQVRLARGGAGTRWSVQAAVRQHEDEYVYNPQTAANRHTSRLLLTQAEVSRSLAPVLVVTGGAVASLRAIDSNNLGRHQDVAAGAFGLVRWSVGPGFTVNASGRVDYDPAYALEVTPQVNVAYNRGRLLLQAGAGRAVRAPNYIERYYNTTLARPRGRDLGNPDLQPERAWAYEAGAGLYPSAGLSLHATAFLRDTRDLIDYAKLSPADTVFLARNLLRVRTRGLELDAALNRSFGAGQVHLSASYTWLDAALGAVEPGVQYKYVLTSARHLLQGSAALDVRGVTFGLQGLWKERLAGDAYAVFNARLGYRWRLGRQQLAVWGEVRNVFDVAYTEVLDAPMPGRWGLVGVRLTR